MTQPTASELADLIERVGHRLKLAERHGPLVEGREVYIRAKDLPEILSALRQVELMKGALEDIAAEGSGAKWFRAEQIMAQPEVIARQALTGEAQ